MTSTNELRAPAGTAGRWEWVGISAADCAAHSMNSLGPFAVSALMTDLHLNTFQAGIWSTVEMVAYAGAMFGISPWAAGLHLRRVALVAGIMVVMAQGASAIVASYGILLALRLLAGTGLGMLNAVVNIGSARSHAPVRRLSLVMIVQTVVFTIASLLLPQAAALGGRTGVFGFLALLVVFLLPLMGFTTSRSSIPRSHRVSITRSGERSCVHSRFIIAAVVFYTSGSLAIWPFSAHVGHLAGLTNTAFGWLAAVANIGGLAMCIAGSLLGDGRAAFRLLAPAVLLTALACVVQAVPWSISAFCTAFLLNYALWFFIYPNLIGIACRMDSSGRLATLCSGAWMISQASVTPLSGLLGRNGHFLGVGLLGMGNCLVSTLLVVGLYFSMHGRIRNRSMSQHRLRKNKQVYARSGLDTYF
ncbi:major facilitator superfamily transporter [Komagataeibacter sucrofermentans DSM 15973]|nr:major facilitator superfamily transporter [Komagataeibacter sucrofermentans DSM 15973]